MSNSTKKFNSIESFRSYEISKNPNNIKILVGKGSCGIAAGANKVFNKFDEQIKNRGLKNIELKQVGCLGLCFSEPNVEVAVPGLPNILYGKVDEKFVTRILEEHIFDKKIINENIFDKPYIDVLDI